LQDKQRAVQLTKCILVLVFIPLLLLGCQTPQTQSVVASPKPQPKASASPSASPQSEPTATPLPRASVPVIQITLPPWLGQSPSPTAYPVPTPYLLQPRPVPSPALALVDAINQFGFKAYQVLAQENKSQNMVFSPLGVSALVAYLYGQSSPEQKGELAKLMGWQNFSDAQIGEYFQAVLEKVKLQDLVKFKLINLHLFCKQEPKPLPQPPYLYELGMGFSFFPLGGTPSQCQNSFNKIAQDAGPFNPTQIPFQQEEVFAQALGFKVQWDAGYLGQDKDPRRHSFLLNSGELISHPKVGIVGTYEWLVSSDRLIRGVSIPSENRMYQNIFLEASSTEWKKNVYSLEQTLNYEYWQKIRQSFERRELIHTYPRFKTEFEFSPLALLEKLNPQIKNEKGVQLLAKTYLDLSQEPLPSSEPLESASEYIMNENYAYFPFTFIVTDKDTGLILLMAAIRNPAQDPL